MKPINTLLSGVAAIALMATPALAQSTDADLSADTETKIITEDGDMSANSSVDAETNDASEEIAEAADATGDAIAEGAEATADATGDAIDAAADQTEEWANEAGEAMEDTTDEIASDMETLGDAVAPSTLTAGALVGTEVMGDTGETIGEVDNVVLVQGKEMAVVGVGGFLGLGEHDVALPLEELTVEGEQLHAAGYTKEELESMAEFDAEAATEVNDDEPVMLGAS